MDMNDRPPAARERISACRPTFASVREIAVGAVVFDRDFLMPATVLQVNGPLLEVCRPTGLHWSVHYLRVRPGTPWEERQLVALARLHKDRRRGMS